MLIGLFATHLQELIRETYHEMDIEITDYHISKNYTHVLVAMTSLTFLMRYYYNLGDHFLKLYLRNYFL